MLRVVPVIVVVLFLSACSSEPSAGPTPEDGPAADVSGEASANEPPGENREDEEKRAWRECRNPGWLDLSVRDVETGVPVKDADYHALKFAFEKDRVEPQFSARISHSPAAESETGRYRWKLAAGWHQIRIDADGYRNKWTPVFRIEKGKETSLEIEMRKANRLKVIVLDEKGEPIEEGGVHLIGDGYRAGMHIAKGVGERLVPVDEIAVTVGDIFLEDYAFQKVSVPLKPGIVNEVTIRLRR
jgi:hypothetical protein